MTPRLIPLLALTGILAACSAVPPERNADLDLARGTFNAAQREAQTSNLAPLELKQASDSLEQAQAAWTDGGPPATVSHLSYLAAQRTAIARELASQRAAKAVVAGAAAERDQMRLAQRTAEADRARQQLAVAKQNSAEKSVALAQADAMIQSSQARADALAIELQELNAQKTDRGLVVTLGDVLFDSGQARLAPASTVAMARLSGAMNRDTTLKAVIEGYTDSVGSAAANLDLSDRRAKAVLTALLVAGVRPEQLSTQGFGEAAPVADNSTAAGRQRNRRVEITFLR
jgi:outer membrane protein OmpA-like peptidoglycan-associated protein